MNDDEPSWYALARRDLERGGETLYLLSDKRISAAAAQALAVEHDELERAGDSDVRWFPVRLGDDEFESLKHDRN